MAIIYDEEKIKLKENKFKRESFEIISAIGRVPKDSRQFVIYGVYLPPNLSKQKATRAAELINENISKIQAEIESPIIIIAGDFNQFGAEECSEDHPDIRTVLSPPTRNEASIDPYLLQY